MRDHSANTTNHRHSRVQAVVDEVVRRRAAGEALSDEDVLGEFPELAEPLVGELAKLRRIEQAGIRADAHPVSETDSAWHSVTPQDTRASSLTGSVIGDFKIVREIGRGGMGVVYEAVQTSLGRKVALKILSAGLGLTPQAVQRFQREAESAAKLHHTNIVPIYATGAENGVHYYAMELIEGPSLDHVIREMRGAENIAPPEETPASANGSAVTAAFEPTSWDSSGGGAIWKSSPVSSGSQYFDTVARLVAEVADALEYAHRHGVVHRDIKPANLLVSPEGRLSLNDFGLARVLEQPGMTITGEILGTPAYMSPEQVAAGRTPLDHRTDIYSLGATLYELLTLRRPFSGARRDQVLSQILHKEPRPPRGINKRVPIDLETICLKAMEKDPDRRYQSAGAMAEDLRRYVNRFAISARRVGPVGKAIKWVRRHPGVAAGLACAGLAIALAGFYAHRASEAESQRLAEQLQSKVQLATLEREHALENALEAATSGDLAKAELAINEAELKGASTADVRVLRGQVAFFRGDYEQALSELEVAVELQPTNVSARSMLVATLISLGDWTRYWHEHEQLNRLQPKTVQDTLLKGYAQHDVTVGLKMMDEAVERSHSPIAHAMRAEVLAYEFSDQEQPALEDVERSLADASAAKEMLPDNLFAQSASLFAHVLAAHVYAAGGHSELERKALQEAARDARSLEARMTLPAAGTALWSYYSLVGTDEQLFDVAKRMAETSTAPSQLLRYAHMLCRRKQYAEALEVLERRKQHEVEGDALRAYILAEMHPDNISLARAAAVELKNRYAQGRMYSGLDSCRMLLLLLGLRDEAIADYRAAQQQSNDNLREIVRSSFDFACGTITESQLLSKHDDRPGLLRARFLAGLIRLNEGDRTRARELFKMAKEVQYSPYVDLDFVATLLVRMEQDPSWPPWIPVKE
jgi:serine/threonine protein kinase/Flp pilus assembly protein TadD